MDAAAQPGVRDVVLMKSSQVGWTEILNNVVGYFIDQDPAPILLVQPTLEIGQAWSKDRLAPMLRDTPCLQGKVRDPRSRDSGNTILHKTFPGGHITIAGANSPAGLASRPIRVTLFDEVDRYPRSAGSEGDPIALGKKRSTTFWNRISFEGSTPTIKGVSKIEARFAESDQRFFYVPCPHCGEGQKLTWSQVQWPDGQPEAALYYCATCGAAWSDGERYQAVAKGQWRATAPFKGIAGFFLNEIYSPWVELGDMAARWLEAKKLPDTLRTFVNTALAETWEEPAEALDEGDLAARREDYGPDNLPAEIVLVTAGIDVQDDRLEIGVEGWGVDQECWAITQHVIYGDPAMNDVWADLDDYLAATLTREDGVALKIAAACIDTGGHFTERVYAYARRRYSRRVWAIKGVTGDRPIVGKPTKQKGGVRLFPVGVDNAKSLIFARLRIPDPGPGYCHFSIGHDDEYFAQVTAEKAIRKKHRGFTRIEWHKVRDRNEALDCKVYSYAAFVNLNPALAKIEARLLKKKETDDERAKPPESETVEKAEDDEDPPRSTRPRRRRRARRQDGFTGNW